MPEQSYFQKALQNFTQDAASLDAVRHLADLGMTVKEIEGELPYPTPHELVQKTVWERLVENGTILLEKPSGPGTLEKAEFVREYNAYGKASFRRVVKKSEIERDPAEYVPCDFGNETAEHLKKRLQAAGVDEKDAEYALGLPWERGIVYHKKTDRICRILRKLSDEK
ncbi:MAG: hypothetical protein IJJ13_02515 [Lachnospiraceae bacterium]|nr:hypothetical protein [Lachnospiraceae bacterium]